MKNLDNRKVISIITLLSAVAFYVAFAIIDGAVICVDSPGYIEMSISREPLYPLYLAFFRLIFGSTGDTYLLVAAIGQCLLAGLCTWSLIDFATKRAKLKPVFEILFLIICISVSLLCRFVAKRGSMYNTCILTESICIPLIMLFSRYILSYCAEKKNKDLVISVILSLIMILTRKQMLITVVLVIAAIIYVNLLSLRTLILIVVCSLAIMGGNKVLDYTYNYAVHGGAFAHFNDNRFLTTVVFYVAEREDGERINEEGLRRLYYDIYDTCDSENSMLHSAEGSVYDRNNHFVDHYDMIQIDHMLPLIREHVDETYGQLNSSEREAKVDEISNSLAWALIPTVWPKMMGLFARNFLYGIVNTVGKATMKIMYPYAIVVFLGYVALLCINIKRNKNNFVNIFAGFTLMAILLNITGVAATIFCQVRYMIYMMPLFYIGLVLLLSDTFAIGRVGESDGE